MGGDTSSAFAAARREFEVPKSSAYTVGVIGASCMGSIVVEPWRFPSSYDSGILRRSGGGERLSLPATPSPGWSFISSHATMDAEHMAELRVILNRVEDQDARNAIVESTIFNFHQFGRVLELI